MVPLDLQGAGVGGVEGERLLYGLSGGRRVPSPEKRARAAQKHRPPGSALLGGSIELLQGGLVASVPGEDGGPLEARSDGGVALPEVGDQPGAVPGLGDRDPAQEELSVPQVVAALRLVEAQPEPLSVSDFLDGTDHRSFFSEWLATARARLTDPATGILFSSFSLEGRAKDGPEGSSIWFAVHCLRLIDEAFARDQYLRAKKELAHGALGFAWAREWPKTWEGPMDVDSGPVIPLLGASAGSSGTAFVAASSFEDHGLWNGLLTSLDFAGFPVRDGDALRYAASNQVGDAVLLYSLVLGPVWKKVGAP